MMVKHARKDFVYSLIDQTTVSGANFLMIALGAHYLPLGDQGKLIYLYAGYIGLVLFNISAFFSVANIVRGEETSSDQYRALLLAAQIAGGILTTLVLVVGFLLFEDALKWNMTFVESALVAAFLLSQQYCDYYRREGYVFDAIRRSAAQSLLVYGLRIVSLYALQPTSFPEFLFILLLSGLPVSVHLVWSHFSQRIHRDTKAVKVLFNKHVRLASWSVYGAPLRWAGLHLPIFLVGALHSIEAAAILGTVRALTTFVNILFELLETIVPAWLFARTSRGADALRAATQLLLLVGLLLWLSGTMAIAGWGKQVIESLLGPAYAQYSDLLLILWSANGIYFVGRVMALHFRMKRNTRIEFVSQTLGIVGLFASLPLIMSHGAWGGAWGLMIIQLATLAGMFFNRYGDGTQVRADR